MKKALTIAGSDSGGGAGIQADLKVFSAFGVFGTCAVTSLTAQNSQGVQGVEDCSPEFVIRQIRSVMEDIGTDAAKTGMLSNGAIVNAVSDYLQQNPIPNLVVDPVMVSKNGSPLLKEDAVEAVVKKLLPLALVVTPNLHEAEKLAGLPVRSVADCETAARKIHKACGCSVLVKGGHGEGDEITDLLFHQNRFFPFRKPRIKTPHTHGTGCTLSAAVAAGLALGKDLVTAVIEAETYMDSVIRGAFQVGNGIGPTHPLRELYRNQERWFLYQQMRQAINMLEVAEIGRLIPEVQSNLAACLSDAEGREEVIGFPGRINRFGNTIRTLAPPEFGFSKHVASIVLAVVKTDPTRRAVMNIRYREDLIDFAKRMGWTVGGFSRKDEPKEVKEKEGSSLEWGTRHVIKTLGFVPDLIYDLGGKGKEEMIRVTGRDPIDVAQKILRLASVVD
jgi:hydroxymethylpyrimidine/phosphomethylpyrimidine kinase